MYILAVDSSHLRASVSVIETVPTGGVHFLKGLSASTAVSASESLLPLVDEVLQASGVGIHQLDAFAVGVGPGSFTGIRIGLATVKTLAQALDKPVASISSLLALSLSADPAPGTLPVAMANAYQGQVFVGWQNAEGQWQEDAQLATQWIETHLNQLQGPVIFVGPGADLYEAAIEQQISTHGFKGACLVKSQVVLSPEGLARAVGYQWERSGASIFASHLDVKANYIRPSQATLNLEKHKQGLVRS